MEWSYIRKIILEPSGSPSGGDTTPHFSPGENIQQSPEIFLIAKTGRCYWHLTG